MNPASEIGRWLETHRHSQERFLASLVKTPSDNPPGDCKPHAEATARMLEELGFTVERCQVPEARVREAGMVSAMNLVVREQFGAGGPTIALNAHGDVVPPGLGWTLPPYGALVADGHMYGRGVAVSKSDLATYTFAVLALKKAIAPLNGSVELHFTYDEEAGGEIGPKWLLEQGITRPDYAICAGFSYDIIVAHNGCLHLEVEITGKSAHAARPETGTDALEASAGIIAGLYVLRKTYARMRSRTDGIESPTLVIGLISGGINTNVVPDNVKFRLDRRIIPDESPDEVEKTLVRELSDLASQWPGIECRVTRILLATPFRPMPGQEQLVGAIRRHARAVLGEELPTRGVPLYTDARHYSAAGIPTVLYGAGPRSLLEANGHRADEKLRLHDLYAATQVVALSLFDMLARKGPTSCSSRPPQESS